jgi:hypothetical protein
MSIPGDLIPHIYKIAEEEGRLISKRVTFRVGNHKVNDIPVPVEPPEVRRSDKVQAVEVDDDDM